ncbi:VWCE [Branchiostoma lanceolatum]|uniref:VWCE protein n=1 Tax=Branchiostoma lanceolatum TaxID=7740 RepID=A0A8J9W1G9_BRALA|nr:VWCE [Branchiostoma lanceolatum]
MHKPLLAGLLFLAFVCFASAQLRGPAGAVCILQASRQVLHTIENKKGQDKGAVCTRQESRNVTFLTENRKKREPSSGVWDYLRMWDVFGITKPRHRRSFVTVYATGYYTDYECCVGWNRIGETCQAECFIPCEHGLCVDTNVCECDEGWVGTQCEHDVDECTHGIDECDRENGACINTEGSYNCSCNDGLHLINGTFCHEIPDTDECARGISGCAQNCHNTHGSYYCSCDAGYTLAADRHACTDINECATNRGGCEHICTNVPGSRNCSCRPNYRLAEGTVCRDDDMYPYGEEAGEVPRRWDFSTCTEESLPPEGFRFFGRRHHQIHICDNGIVAFDRINRPRILNLNTVGFRKAAVLAPFLANSNAELLDNLPEADRTKIYYSFYERGDGKAATDRVLQRARNDGISTPGYFSIRYEPVWALVVTWTRVPPDCSKYSGGVCPRDHDQLPHVRGRGVSAGSRPTTGKFWGMFSMYGGGVCPRDHDQLPVNDFQLAISTNGTHSYATFVYPARKLEWVSGPWQLGATAPVTGQVPIPTLLPQTRVWCTEIGTSPDRTASGTDFLVGEIRR